MSTPPASRLRRIGVQVILGFSAGLPLLLTRSTLSTWFGDLGVNKEDAFLFLLVALPYNLKLLWAPFLDRVKLPWLDRRRDWMVTTQLLLMVAIFALGAMDPTSMLGPMALVALAVAFLAASQDIVLDAYRTDLMPPGERGSATGLYVAGYRVAMIAAGAGALLVAEWISWREAYWMLGLLMLVGVAGTLFGPRLESQVRPRSVREAFVEPLRELAGRRGAAVVLAFVLLFKVGDTVAMPMASYFLPAEDGGGYSLAEIALVQKAFGMIAAIGGAIAGGYIVDRIGVLRGLLIFGIAQALANVGYAYLAMVPPTHSGLIAAVGIDQLCNGLGTAAFVAYLMALCHQRFSATQYALFTSASTLIGHTLGAGSGYLIEGVGWAWSFIATILVAAPALLLIPFLPKVDEDGA